MTADLATRPPEPPRHGRGLLPAVATVPLIAVLGATAVILVATRCASTTAHTMQPTATSYSSASAQCLKVPACALWMQRGGLSAHRAELNTRLLRGSGHFPHAATARPEHLTNDTRQLFNPLKHLLKESRVLVGFRILRRV